MCKEQDQLFREQEELKLEEELKREEELKLEEEKRKQAELLLGTHMEFSYDSEEISDERLKQMETLNKQSIEQAISEKIRLGLLKEQPQTQTRITAPVNKPPEFDAYANMTARKRKKLDSRRKDNKKKAEKQKIPGATEDTLPMMNEVKNYNKAREQVGPVKINNLQNAVLVNLNANIFSPVPYKEGCDTTFNISGIRTEIDKINAIVEKYKTATDKEKTPEIGAKCLFFERIGAQMTETLKTIMASNGVNYLTGAPVTKEEQELAQINKAASLTAYRELMKKRDEMELKEYERILSPQLDEWEQEWLEDNKISFKSESENLPFTFSNYVSAESYEKLRKVFDGNPGKYAEHKDMIDKMYLEYLDISKILSEMNRRSSALNNKDSIGKGGRTIDPFKEKLRDILLPREKVEILNHRRETLENIMRYMLAGRKLEGTDEHIVLENEFGVVTEERKKQKDKLFETEEKERKRISESSPTELSPVGTELTGKLALAVFDKNRELKPSIEYYNKKLKEWQANPKNKGVYFDIRIMLSMVNGYKTDKNGEPLNDEEKLKRDRDIQLIDDYLSNDYERREKWLNEIVDKVINFDYSENLHSEDYLKENSVQMMRFSVLVLIIDNLQKENKEYFTRNPERVMKLNELGDLPASMSMPVSFFFSKHGVDGESVKADPKNIIREFDSLEKAQRNIENMTDSFTFTSELYKQRLADYKQKQEQKQEKKRQTEQNVTAIQGVQTRDRTGEIDPTKFTPFTEKIKNGMRGTTGIRGSEAPIKEQFRSANVQQKEEIDEFFAGVFEQVDLVRINEGVSVYQVSATAKIKHSPEHAAVMLKMFDIFLKYLENADYGKFFSTVYQETIQLTKDPNSDLFGTFESRESKVMSDIMCTNMLPWAHILTDAATKGETAKKEFMIGIQSNIYYMETLFKKTDLPVENMPPDIAVVFEKYKIIREKLLGIFRANTPPQIITDVKTSLGNV